MGYLLAFWRWLKGQNPWVHCWYSPDIPESDDKQRKWDDWEAHQNQTCLLLVGHWGPHRYTPSEDIVVSFK